MPSPASSNQHLSSSPMQPRAPPQTSCALPKQLWRVRWENAYAATSPSGGIPTNAGPTSARMLGHPLPLQRLGPADCAHCFWACPVARAVFGTVSAAAAAAQPRPAPLARSAIWLAWLGWVVRCMRCGLVAPLPRNFYFPSPRHSCFAAHVHAPYTCTSAQATATGAECPLPAWLDAHEALVPDGRLLPLPAAQAG